MPASEISATENACPDAREQPRAFPRSVVLVIGSELAPDAEMREELPAVARVLGRDQVGAGEHGERAERNVGEIADRRRHEIEPGGKRPLELLGERGFRALKQPAREVSWTSCSRSCTHPLIA